VRNSPHMMLGNFYIISCHTSLMVTDCMCMITVTGSLNENHFTRCISSCMVLTMVMAIMSVWIGSTRGKLLNGLYLLWESASSQQGVVLEIGSGIEVPGKGFFGCFLWMMKSFVWRREFQFHEAWWWEDGCQWLEFDGWGDLLESSWSSCPGM